MDFGMIWPIGLIVFANIFYNLSTKGTPEGANPFVSLTVTYFVGTVCCGLLYFALNKGGNLLYEYKQLNWTSVVLGLAVVGLEVGSIYMYKSGWDISKGHFVHSSLLIICLTVIGALFFKEGLSLTKIAGIGLFIGALVLINL